MCMHAYPAVLHDANMFVSHMQLRGLGGGAAATCNWITNAVVSQTFLTLIQHLGGSGTFWLYAVIALAGAVWVYSALPETNGEQSPTMSTISPNDQQSQTHVSACTQHRVVSRGTQCCLTMRVGLLDALALYSDSPQ